VCVCDTYMCGCDAPYVSVTQMRETFEYDLNGEQKDPYMFDFQE